MKFLKIENANDYCTISLNRPEVKNAFHPEMIAELTEAFKKVKSSSQLKFVVLAGEGTVFSAGADLNWMKEMVQYSFEQNQKDSEKLWEMFEAIAFCDVPVIGVVQGAAYGGALGLIACCDYVFMEEKTQLCFSEVKLGLAPAVISSFVRRKVSDGMSRPLMLSAEIFSVERALAIGLTHAKFLGEFNNDTLKPFSKNGAEAIRETKKLLDLIPTVSWAQQKVATTKVISERRVSAEGQNLLKQYLNK